MQQTRRASRVSCQPQPVKGLVLAGAGPHPGVPDISNASVGEALLAADSAAGGGQAGCAKASTRFPSDPVFTAVAAAAAHIPLAGSSYNVGKLYRWMRQRAV